MTTKTMTKTKVVVCAECAHENETERVYCHNCGARLERAAVVKEKEDLTQTRKRVRKMFGGRRDRFRLRFSRITKFVLGSFGLAVLIQVLLPPDVPVPAKLGTIAPQVRIDLENLITRHQPEQLQYSEEQINAYLTYALRPKQSSLNKPLLDFKRLVVGFRENVCEVTAERSLFGLSLYTRCTYEPTINEGKIVASTKAGHIGRLPIHPRVAEFMDVLFLDVWNALAAERKLIEKAGIIEFHDKNVVFRPLPQS